MKTEKIIFENKCIKLTGSKGGLANKNLIPLAQNQASDQQTLEQRAKEDRPEDKKDTTKSEINKLKNKSKRTLLHIKGRFPFDFFPDEIIVDEEKITIYQSYFIKSFAVKTIILDEVEDVECEFTLFLGTLVLYIKGEKDPLRIGALTVSDATKAKEIILGRILLKKEGIEPDTVEEKQLSDVLSTIGSPHFS